MRRKKSEHPEVFGFRIIAGTVGSFATTRKVREANSLAFVDGVPIFERFFLGDEFTIRGYNVRSISPIAPVDTFITSQNVVVAENASGDPVAIPSLQGAAVLGTFTGIGGSNVASLPRSFTSVGGDTQTRKLRIPHTDHRRRCRSRCVCGYRQCVQRAVEGRSNVLE
jgi:outer membrane protein insertion porin family